MMLGAAALALVLPLAGPMPSPKEADSALASREKWAMRLALLNGITLLPVPFLSDRQAAFVDHTGLSVSASASFGPVLAAVASAGAFGWADAGGARLGGRDAEVTVELREKESLAPERAQLYQATWHADAGLDWRPLASALDLPGQPVFDAGGGTRLGLVGLALPALTQDGENLAFVRDAPSAAVAGIWCASARLRWPIILVELGLTDRIVPLSVRDGEVADAEAPAFAVRPFSTVDLSLGVHF
ncbi:MAG: hypothetical protein HYS27_09720 [Deltaproteobacteria bacterium]|nr:hypothetical protein [Deltaproteobacteria bacterium]